MKMFSLFLLLCSFNLMAEDLKINSEKSMINFGITKYKIGKIVSGKFNKVSGTIGFEDGSITSVKGEIATSSIDTDEEKRDKHLVSEDFFNAKEFPTMSFVSSGPILPGKNGYVLRGKLTIKDVTKDVTWTIQSISEKEKSVSFKIEETIDRYEYNIKWNKRLDSEKEESWTEKVANAAKGLISKYVIDKDVKIELLIVADK